MNENNLLLRWEFPKGGHLEVRGVLADLSIHDLADVIEALLILKRHVYRITERQDEQAAAKAPDPCDLPPEPEKNI